jgi:alpha-tubulin suppressor-like RCC1 family protein
MHLFLCSRHPRNLFQFQLLIIYFFCFQTFSNSPLAWADEKTVEVASSNKGACDSHLNKMLNLYFHSDKIEQISSGAFHALILKEGLVHSIGFNSYGQLGLPGVARKKDIYTPVPSLNGVRDIATGDFHSMALKNDGTLYAWGLNEFGQLGTDIRDICIHEDRKKSCSRNPILLPKPKNIQKISGGGYHTLALDEKGLVWAWGKNEYGQAGNEKIQFNSPPIKLPLKNVVDISAGAHHSLALKSDGTVWAWGSNGFGQLGNPESGKFSPVPFQVLKLDGILAITAGADHSLAIKKDGTVWSWGANWYGQLGDGSTLNQFSPVQVQNLDQALSVSGGVLHSTAIKKDGSVWAWGNNEHHQLANETLGKQSLIPAKIKGVTGKQLSSGWHHTLLINDRLQLFFWGYPFHSHSHETDSSLKRYFFNGSSSLWSQFTSFEYLLKITNSPDYENAALAKKGGKATAYMSHMSLPASNAINDSCISHSLKETWTSDLELNAWWQVDLGGKKRKISMVAIFFRTDHEDKNQTNQFKILASNDPDFIEHVEFEPRKGMNFPPMGFLFYPFSEKKPYRYIRLINTSPAFTSFTEVQVYVKVTH